MPTVIAVIWQKTPEELQKLDSLTTPFLPEGYLEDIAIRVYPLGGGAFTAANIPEFGRLIRRTDNLAVRALFLPFDQSGDYPDRRRTLSAL